MKRVRERNHRRRGGAVVQADLQGPALELGPGPLPCGAHGLWEAAGTQGAHQGLTQGRHRALQHLCACLPRVRTSSAVRQTASAGPSASQVGVSVAPSPALHNSKTVVGPWRATHPPWQRAHPPKESQNSMSFRWHFEMPPVCQTQRGLPPEECPG